MHVRVRTSVCMCTYVVIVTYFGCCIWAFFSDLCSVQLLVFYRKMYGMFYANDEPEGKFLYAETIKLYCIVLYCIVRPWQIGPTIKPKLNPTLTHCSSLFNDIAYSQVSLLNQICFEITHVSPKHISIVRRIKTRMKWNCIWCPTPKHGSKFRYTRQWRCCCR